MDGKGSSGEAALPNWDVLSVLCTTNVLGVPNSLIKERKNL